MILKLQEKEKAIKLRKNGLSYSEILRKVPVAKSTLSLWLRSIGLAKRQKQRLTEKKLNAMKLGWEACRQKRLRKTEEIKTKARNEIEKLSNRELWLIGAALYWAEGTKEKSKSMAVKFSNSDPQMIKLFLEWLCKICKIAPKDIYFEIYLHETASYRKKEIQNYWLEITNFPPAQFKEIIWKKHNLNPKRKNIGNDYHGQLRICVKKSSNFNRKITGWIEGIYKNCGVV